MCIRDSFLRYMDPHNKDAIASKEALDYWSPVDWYNGGMEHTTDVYKRQCRMCSAAVIRRQSLPPASGRIPARPGVPVCCTMSQRRSPVRSS